MLGFETLEERRLLTTTLLADNFDSGVISSSLWSVRDALVSRDNETNGPHDPPSAPYAVELDGLREMLTSKTIDLSDYVSATLSYQIQAGGHENAPEPEDTLLVEYLNSSGNWWTYITWTPGSGSGLLEWVPHTVSLPWDAFHSNFAFRFNASNSDTSSSIFGTTANDDWFIDSVKLVGNRRPTAGTSGDSGNVNDGGTYTLNWTASDPDGDAITVRADILKGSTILRSSTKAKSSLQVLPTDGLGTFTLRVTATDSSGAAFSAYRYLYVQDDDPYQPTIGLSGSNGTEFASANQRFTWSIYDASGSTGTATITKNGEEIFFRQYSANVSNDSFDFNDYGVGSYVITLYAIDDDDDRANDRSSRTVSRIVNVLNTPPVASLAITTTEQHRIEGASITFDGSASSDSEGDSLVYVWNFGDGSLGRGATVNHDYRDDGQYNVELTVVDEFGGVSSSSQLLQIANVVPHLEASSPLFVGEMRELELALAVTDPGDDDVSAMVDWGDGHVETFTDVRPQQHVYANGGQLVTLRVSLQDEDGRYNDVYVAAVDVQNAAPLVRGLPDFLTADVTEELSFNVQVVDGEGDTFSFLWDFGDGVTEQGTHLENVSHAYASAGVYVVTLTVADSDGLSTHLTTTASVGSPVTFVTSTQTVGESSGVWVITAALQNGNALSNDVMIPIVISGEVDAADYQMQQTAILIPAGQLQGSANIVVFDDLLNENDEQLTIGMGLTLGASHGQVDEYHLTIQDNDAKPTVFFGSGNRILGESDGRIPVIAQLSGIAGRDIFVPLVFSGAAELGIDYLAPEPAGISVRAGESSGMIELILIDDNTIEGAETLGISMLASQQAVLSQQIGQPATVTFVIESSDAPIVNLDSAYRVVAEDSASIQITARLSRFTDELIQVPFSISGTADNGIDYRIVNATLQFFPGSSDASILVRITDDIIAEGIEDFFIELHETSNAILGPGRSVLTDILDNDQVRVSFDAGTVTEFEGTSNIPIKVRLSNPSSTATSIGIAVTGSAVIGSDFSISTTNLVVPAGSQEGTVFVTLIDDSINELPETVFLSLATIQGGVAGERVSKTIGVRDTDPLVRLLSTSRSFNEADGTADIYVQLSAPTNQAVVIPVKYSGTASRGQDFQGPLTVTVPAGDYSAKFTVSIIDDSVVESAESIGIALGDPSLGELSTPRSTTLTILDNDVPPALVWGKPRYNVSEDGGSVELSVQLTRPAPTNVQVNLTYVGDGASLHADYERGAASVTIPAGSWSAKVSIPIINDDIKEDFERLNVSFASAINASLPNNPSEWKSIVSIQDDDILTAAEFQLLMEKVTYQVNTTSSSSSNMFSTNGLVNEYHKFLNSPTAQGDVVDGILLTVKTVSGFLPPPWNIAVKLAAHTVTYLRAEYPQDGWINSNEIARDIERDEWKFFRDLGTELLKEAGLCMIGNWLGGSIDVSAFGTAIGEYIGGGIVFVADYIGENVTDDDIKDGWNYYTSASSGSKSGKALGGAVSAVKSWGGYGAGAQVFLDVDFNGIRSSYEPFAETTADGFSLIQGVDIADINDNSILDFAEGQWVSVGGIDTSINEPFLIPFLAPVNYTMVTPSSTLISKLIDSGAFDRDGAGIRSAEQRYLAALGLVDRPLADLDFLYSAANGDVNAAKLFAKETQWYNTIVMLASLFDGASPNLDLTFFAEIALQDVASKIAAHDSGLDVSKSLVVSNLLKGIAVRTGLNVDSNASAVAVDAIAKMNELIALLPVEGSRAFLNQVVKVQKVAQGDLLRQLTQLGAGDMLLSEFQSNTADLNNQVAAAQSYNVVPVYLMVSDASITEGNQGTTQMEFVVTPLAESAVPFSVDYFTADATASDLLDYQSKTGTLSWDAGDETSRLIVVDIIGDLQLESDEYFTLFLTNPFNVAILSGTASGLISNDDLFVHETTQDDANDLLLAVNGTDVVLVQDGQVVFDRNFESGVELKLIADAADKLELLNPAADEIVIHRAVNGSQTIFVGPHKFFVEGITRLNSKIASDIANIPRYIFAETALTVTAVPPLAFDNAALTYAWGLYADGASLPILTGDSPEFRFVPATSDQRLELTITDGVRTSTLQHDLFVYPPNVAPEAIDDFDTTGENAALTVDVIENDYDINLDDVLSLLTDSAEFASAIWDYDSSSIALVDASLAISGNTITFDPGTDFDFLAENELATVEIRYTVTDDDPVLPLTDSGILTVQVFGKNDQPLAFVISGSASEDEPATTLVLANVLDVDVSDVHTFSIDSTNTIGTVTNQSDGTFHYAPSGRFERLAAFEITVDTFIYTVNDGHGGLSSAIASITIIGQNDLPEASDDRFVLDEDGVLTVEMADGLLANDRDVDGDKLHIATHSEPQYGSLLLNDDGSLIYVPVRDFYGMDSFSYVARDPFGGLASASVFVFVNPVIDAVIDVKPGNQNGADSINLQSNGNVPMAIMSTQVSSGEADDFDPTIMDLALMSFRINGASIAPRKMSLEDVDDDGDMDLLLHFYMEDLAQILSDADTHLALTSEFGGAALGYDLGGRVDIRIVPTKTKKK